MDLTKNGARRLMTAAVVALGLGAMAGACRRPSPPAATVASAGAAADPALRPPSPHHGVRSLAEGNGPIARPEKLWSPAPLREVARSPGVAFHAIADASFVYTALENGEIRRAPKAGGPATTLFKLEPRDSLYFLAQDDDALYFARPAGLYRLAKSGGAPTTLVEDTTPDPTLREQLRPHIAVDGRFVYFASMRNDGQVSLARVAKTGGRRALLGNLDGDVQAMAVDDATIYWASLDQVKEGFKTSIRAMTKKGGAVKRLADRGGFVNEAALILVGDEVVWADGGMNGVVASVSKHGGPARALATSPRGVAPYLATDGHTLFWAEGYSRGLYGQQWGLVMSVPPSGGPSVAVTSELKQIGGLAADSSGVYVAEGFSSRVGTQVWAIPPA